MLYIKEDLNEVQTAGQIPLKQVVELYKIYTIYVNFMLLNNSKTYND